ncbi:ankyrin repeat protein [endosymbiont of Acanthamoeba sp. UWC8]|uniref:ankyrin repeat domain-containing protein n=1 Tax=endosymbiont of Acanthamoeba sp. UWC8 TaxID=86106 RepID=UPI0004D1B7AC|nr:ankyrin repeat domain-containing protein [endosymbiont of Acanthamoeba sp. UWC8]AIF82050.1 ankyrin repeat protein [endosymbiont of Acanthamoeba sp. UWC8]
MKNSTTVYRPLSEQGKIFIENNKDAIKAILASFSWIEEAYIEYNHWRPIYFLEGNYKMGYFQGAVVQEQLEKFYLKREAAFNAIVLSGKKPTSKLFYNAEEYKAKDTAEKARIAEELKKAKEGLDVNGRIELYEEEVILAIKQAFVEMAGIFIGQKQQKLVAGEDNIIHLKLSSISNKEVAKIKAHYFIKYDTDNEKLIMHTDYNNKDVTLTLNFEMLFDKVLPKLREHVLNKYGNIVSPEDSEQVKAMKSILGDEEVYNSLIKRDNIHKFLLAAKNNDMEAIKKLNNDYWDIPYSNPEKVYNIIEILGKVGSILRNNELENSLALEQAEYSSPRFNVREKSKDEIIQDLKQACKDENTIEIIYLLTSPNLKFTCNTMHDCFTLAANNGHIKVLELLLKYTNSAETNNEISTYTFICAAENGNIKVLELLLKYIKDPKKRLEVTVTAFTHAAKNRNIGVLELLLRQCLNDDEKDMLITSADYAPFRYAAKNGNIEVLELLLKHTSSQEKIDNMIHARYDDSFFNAGRMRHIEVLELLIKYTPDHEKRNEMIHARNNKLFINATAKNKPEVLKFLLNHTPEQEKRNEMIHMRDDQGFINAAKNGHIEVLKLLLDYIPDERIRYQMFRAQSDTIITSIAESGKVKVLNFLIENTPNQEKREEIIHAQNNIAFIYSIPLYKNLLFRTLISSVKFGSISEFLKYEIIPILREETDRKYIETYMCLDGYFTIVQKLNNLHFVCKNIYSSFKEQLAIPHEISSYIFSIVVGIESRAQLEKIEAIKGEVNEESNVNVGDGIIRKVNSKALFIEKIIRYDQTLNRGVKTRE